MNLFSHSRAPMEAALCPIPLPHAAALSVAILLAAAPGLMAAEGPISAMQEALKREELYTGETTGVLDAPTRAALRRFQILHALPVSGEIDSPTLQALEKRATPAAVSSPVEVMTPPAAEPPAPPPEVVEGDRQFLKQVENAAPSSPMISEPAPLPVVTTSDTAEPLDSTLEPTRLAKTASVKAKPAATKKRAVEKEREETVRVERALPAETGETPQAPLLEPFTDSEPRRPVARFAPSALSNGERESDADITAGSGVKVTRTITTTTGRDGRTQILKKSAPAIAEAPGPEVVEVPAAVPRARRPNFFERLFHRSPD